METKTSLVSKDNQSKRTLEDQEFQWITTICCVTFDIELGQVIEWTVGKKLSNYEKAFMFE